MANISIGELIIGKIKVRRTENFGKNISTHNQSRRDDTLKMANISI